MNCGIDCIKNLLLRIKLNPNTIRSICSSETEIDDLLQVIDYCKEKERQAQYQYDIYTINDYEDDVFKVKDGEFSWKGRIGTILSYYWDQNLIFGPNDIMHRDGYIVLANYYAPVNIFDNSWSYIGFAGIYGGTPTASNRRIRYIDSADLTNEAKLVAVALGYDHMIKVFKRDGSGSFSSYQLGGAPKVVRFVENYPNQIIVATTNGGTINQGQILAVEFDQDTMTFGAEHVILDSISYGQAWDFEVYRPKDVKIYLNPNTSQYEMFVVYGGDYNYVARFVYEPDNYKISDLIKVYSKTPGMDANNVIPEKIVVDYDENVFYAAVRGAQRIVRINLDTGDIESYLGEISYENWAGNPNTPGYFNSLTGITMFMNPDNSNTKYVVVADYGNNRVQQFFDKLFDLSPIQLTYTPQYNYDFEYLEFISSDKFNYTTNTYITNYSELLHKKPPKEIIVAGKVLEK